MFFQLIFARFILVIFIAFLVWKQHPCFLLKFVSMRTHFLFHPKAMVQYFYDIHYIFHHIGFGSSHYIMSLIANNVPFRCKEVRFCCKFYQNAKHWIDLCQEQANMIPNSRMMTVFLAVKLNKSSQLIVNILCIIDKRAFQDSVTEWNR